MNAEDRKYALRIVDMAKRHSSEAFYALDDPLEAACLSVLVEILKAQEQDRKQAQERLQLQGSVPGQEQQLPGQEQEQERLQLQGRVTGPERQLPGPGQEQERLQLQGSVPGQEQQLPGPGQEQADVDY
jgi:hypothetical protein